MALLCLLGTLAGPEPTRLGTDLARWEFAGDGRCVSVRVGETEVLARPQPFARVVVAGVDHPAGSLRWDGTRLTVGFEGTPVEVVLGVTATATHLVVEILEVRGDAESVTLVDLPLTPEAQAGDGATVCAFGRNLQVMVPELPGPMARPRAVAFARTGLIGASVALIACPADRLRGILKDVVTGAPAVPTSAVGGPWALEGPNNRSSYIFCYGELTETTVDAWIERARSVGFNQIQFHGGRQFRFGDCRLDPEVFPRGLDSLRAVVDKLHAAGMIAGMQPYAFFIAKQSEWVTPKPDPRLATQATFTLAAPIDATTDTLPTVEPTTDVSTVTGFFVRNSVTLRCEDELIVFSDPAREPPYGFRGCQRGALGTTAAAHPAGARLDQLKECFGLFVPDPETTLFAEVAQRHADLFNQAGFDTIYFDALDGEGILAGNEWAWHYGAKFVWEVYRRLERPAVIEYSTFHHHLWTLRSRMGAWDHPSRGHRRFIDLHVAANLDNTRRFLPSNLGWWAFLDHRGHQVEPTFGDTTDYLGCKAVGTDSGLSIVAYDPAAPGQARQAARLREYELLRQAGTVPERIRARLREPGAEFTLRDGRFYPVAYQRSTANGGAELTVAQPYAAQPPSVRIEALPDAGAWEAPEARPVVDFATPPTVADAAEGVTLDPAGGGDLAGRPAAARLTATSTRPAAQGAWARLAWRFDPPLDLSATPALGVWVHGDGSGALLNVQLGSPDHLSHGAVGEHYVDLDFVGWRYLVLLEPDSDRWPDLGWPYGNHYTIFREQVLYNAIDEVSLWLNRVPLGGRCQVALSAIRALPLQDAPLARPSLRRGDATLVFPVDLPVGGYLEWEPGRPARVYDGRGAETGQVTPEGTPPRLAAGDVLTLSAAGRSRWTIGFRGEALE